MRLLHTRTLELVDFSTAQSPPYAILSHTWGDEEVSYLNLQDDSVKGSTSWQKILQTCAIAREQEIDYAWIDTCCIDRTSSAELTEAINSMFQWYKHAAVCYAHLEDLVFSQYQDICLQLKPCRWWSRGWTLQELIAPQHLEFYDQKWTKIGTKADLASVISKISMVPRRILLDSLNLGAISVATRMAWAANRVTSRPEDEAYCLLGIFGVNMPLIYGEGKRSFRRLQEEIIKRKNDLTIFASDDNNDLLADSPRGFREMRHLSDHAQSTDFAITNRGLKFSGDMALFGSTCSLGGKDPLNTTIGLLLGYDEDKNRVMLWLRKVQPRLYRCHPVKKLERVSSTSRLLGRPTTDFYIVVEWTPAMDRLSQVSREDAMHIPAHLGDCAIVPHMLWDPEDRLILKPSRQERVLAIAIDVDVKLDNGTKVDLVVLHRQDSNGSSDIFLMQGDEKDRICKVLYEHDDRGLSLSWTQLMLHAPLIANLSNQVKVVQGEDTWQLTGFLEVEATTPNRPKICFAQRRLSSRYVFNHSKQFDFDHPRATSI